MRRYEKVALLVAVAVGALLMYALRWDEDWAGEWVRRAE